MRNMIAKVYETLNKIGDVWTSPTLMAEFYRRQYLGAKEAISLCMKHIMLVFLVPEFSMLAGICWLAWKSFLILARFEEWLSSFFQIKKKKGISWE